MLVSALFRGAETEGGFVAVLAKGDPPAGAVVVILAERGFKRRFLERQPGPDGDYCLADSGGESTEGRAISRGLLARRRRRPRSLGGRTGYRDRRTVRR